MLDVAATHCKHYSLSMSYYGRYCPCDGTVTLHLLPYQCRYVCFQSTNCKAYNYNTTEGTCKHFTSPCPQAINDDVMQFGLYTEKPRDQFYQWVPYRSGDTIDPRMIFTDNPGRYISRMQRHGNDIVSYFNTFHKVCFANWGGSFIIPP